MTTIEKYYKLCKDSDDMLGGQWFLFGTMWHHIVLHDNIIYYDGMIY